MLSHLRRMFVGIIVTFSFVPLFAQDVYQEENGLIVIEAENVQLTGDWQVQTSISGYTGDGYINWVGPDYFTIAGNGVLEYRFNISSPGTYTIKYRMNHQGAPADDQWNDIWARFDSETKWIKAFHPGAEMNKGWTFVTLWEVIPEQQWDQITRSFSAGEHVMYLSARSAGLKIDRIHMYLSSVSNPTSTSYPESPTAAGANRPPKVSAGEDLSVTLPTNTATISGSATDESAVASYLWTKESGPQATLSNQSTATLSLSALTAGTYVFRLTATDDSGATAFDEMVLYVNDQSSGNDQIVSGEKKLYHPLTLTFDGPSASEGGSPNPFKDYRLNVTFTNGSTSLTVPGYFAADGDAANTSATSGNKWRVHFTPSKMGTWNYSVSMRQGTDIAASTDATAGSPVSPLDGYSDSFVIGATDKSGRDFRGKGILRYVDEHYPRFDNGDYFVKAGSGDPENFLSYSGFDNTPTSSSMPRHSYQPHEGQWNVGDPTWQTSKGKGIIGLVNYFADLGCNTLYFLLWSGGDSKNGYPWTSATSYLDYDCSKLDQWEIVLNHMNNKGIHLHMFFQEEEVDMVLNNGNLGTERKIYFREMIARFGHYNAITWNLGEELNRGVNHTGGTDPSTTQIKSWCDYIKQLDPYGRPIGGHPYNISALYNPLLGYQNFDAATIQSGDNLNDVYTETLKWVQESENNGHPWLVSNDEQGGWQLGLEPTHSRMDEYRKKVLWGALMAGGFGAEYYYGMEGLETEDYTVYEQAWRECGLAVDFFQKYVRFQKMTPNKNLVGSGNWCMAFPDSMYLVYMPNGGSTTLNLAGVSGTFDVQWYDPRQGGELQTGSVQTVNGGGSVSLGQAPNNSSEDWAVLVSLKGMAVNSVADVSPRAIQDSDVRFVRRPSGLALHLNPSLTGSRVAVFDMSGRMVKSLGRFTGQSAADGVVELNGCGTGARLLVITRGDMRVTRVFQAF